MTPRLVGRFTVAGITLLLSELIEGRRDGPA